MPRARPGSQNPPLTKRTVLASFADVLLRLQMTIVPRPVGSISKGVAA